MRLLGLAGRTGAGKNHVAGLLVRRGWRELDLDEVAHRALDALSGPIVAEFGTEIVSGGRIDRGLLGALVFNHPDRLRRLEAITYPWIEDQTVQWILSDPATPAVIHAVNLHKSSLPERCDAVIWVAASEHLRRRRVMKRDGRSWEALKGRFRSQKGLNPKLFSRRAETYIVRNSGNDVSLNASLDRILRRLEHREG